MSMRKIEVDEEVYRALQKLATPFEDTPNTVLRRLLRLDEVNAPQEDFKTEDETISEEYRHDQIIQRLLASRGITPKSTFRSRIRGGISQDDFRIPILEILVEKGGGARASDVIEILRERMSDQFQEEDLQPVPSGGCIRWENKARWARYDMVLEGLLRSDSPVGIWEISEKGREFLQEVKKRLESLQKFEEAKNENPTTNSSESDV